MELHLYNFITSSCNSLWNIYKWNINIFVYNLLSTYPACIGILYFIISFCGGSYGLALSALLRTQISMPAYCCLDNNYHSVITSHGLYMIFYFIMPWFIGGVVNILYVMQLYTDEFSLPRLNAVSLWLLYLSFIIYNIGNLTGLGISGGWTLYPPLVMTYNIAIDLSIISLHFAGLSSIFTSANIIATLLSCYIYSFNIWSFISSYSLFIWAAIITAIMLILAIPILAVAITFLLCDRYF